MRMSTCVSEENLIVTTQEVRDGSKVAPGDVVTASRRVSTEALTLGDLMSMEDSQRSLNNSNTHGPEENIDRETEDEITEESMEGSQRSLNNSNTHGPEENIERETEEPVVGSLRYLSSVIEESCDHDLFSRRPSRMTNSGPSSARMIDSEPISFSGFRSVRSEGSSVSASSFGFPM
ncbi:PREDICTED: uncharacterized protein LOC104772586 [Camelina sativa]|uniref:Uncharacterized protein LOC104772586 n=1 Tax=Camelina sativa TaxID=90675 RepID=A0ABM1RD95_CAMSA|nr:PREDICTED: uncharacterized protein LOC104772586 [Camelina sativa]